LSNWPADGERREQASAAAANPRLDRTLPAAVCGRGVAAGLPGLRAPEFLPAEGNPQAAAAVHVDGAAADRLLREITDGPEPQDALRSFGVINHVPPDAQVPGEPVQEIVELPRTGAPDQTATVGSHSSHQMPADAVPGFDQKTLSRLMHSALRDEARRHGIDV
jgi:hypothetical protein